VLRLAFLTVQANAEQNAFFERDKWMQNASETLARTGYLSCLLSSIEKLEVTF